MAYPTPPTYTGSKAQTSQGTSIWVQTAASPVTWVFIGECLGATFSDKNMFDKSTNLQSTAEEFLALLQDPGKLNIELNRVSTDAGQAALSTSYHNAPPTKLPYSVVFPVNTAAGQSTTGDQRNFNAYVEDFSPQVKVNTRITTKFTLQISGAITEVEGS